MARAQKIAAVAHEAGGDSRSAQVELRSARAVFERLGAGPELAAAGARIDPGAGGEAGGASLELSPRELDVLRLAAEGLTDSQIASRLVLSPHTVHRHLSNIRTKTNQRSRTAAVAQAARAGLI